MCLCTGQSWAISLVRPANLTDDSVMMIAAADAPMLAGMDTAQNDIRRNTKNG